MCDWQDHKVTQREREHRQIHGKISSVSFATKRGLDNLHTKIIATSVLADGLSPCGSSCSWPNKTSSESEFAATD